MSDIKLCKNKRKEYKLRSSIALERKKSENYKKSYENNININKKNKKLYRIKSIDENLFKKVFSVDKLNKNKIKKDNNNNKERNDKPFKIIKINKKIGRIKKNSIIMGNI